MLLCLDKGSDKPILAPWVPGVTTGQDEHEVVLYHYHHLRVIARRGTIQSVATRLCLSRPKGYPIMFDSAQGYPIGFETPQRLSDYVLSRHKVYSIMFALAQILSVDV
jgi:hypothetical protein